MTYTSLTLNGKHLHRTELLALAHDTLRTGTAEDWEVAFFDFVMQWLNPEPYLIVKSSGTTGAPKEIRLGKQQMVNSARMTANYLGLREGDNALLSLSANYIAGKMMIIQAMVSGMNLITIAPSNNPFELLPASQSIDFTAWVPMQMQNLLEDMGNRWRIAQIKTIILGGSPVSKELELELAGFPNHIYETFGMTETISHIAMRKISGGKTAEDFETTDEQFILGQDDRDCLVVIAPGITNSPVVTNDVVDIKDDRHFRWIGRVDNVVNSGGIKLFPEQLEEKVQALFTERFFMAGVPDSELGQKLILVLENSNTGQKTELIDKLKAAITNRYEVPRDIIFTPALEETESGKINRKATLKKLGLIE